MITSNWHIVFISSFRLSWGLGLPTETAWYIYMTNSFAVMFTYLKYQNVNKLWGRMNVYSKCSKYYYIGVSLYEILSQLDQGNLFLLFKITRGNMIPSNLYVNLFCFVLLCFAPFFLFLFLFVCSVFFSFNKNNL